MKWMRVLWYAVAANSGHTEHIFRQLPTAAILPRVKLVIPSGSYIDLDSLKTETKSTGIEKDRLLISQNAVLITQQCKQAELNTGLIHDIGSTGSGTGATVQNRINRNATQITCAKDCNELKAYVVHNLAEILNASLAKHERIILEGTQGFGLSLLHSPFYPFVTSRDTPAAAFVAEAGLSPRDVDDIVLVIRAYPIRVAGSSGPLPNEITWESLTQEGDFQEPIQEYTSVTHKLRRVAKFDPEIVKQAILHNQPTRIVLNHVDYVKKEINENTQAINQFIQNIEQSIGRSIDFIGLSPKDLHSINVYYSHASIHNEMLSST